VRDVLPVLQRVAGFIGDNLKPILIAVGVAFALLTAPITTVVAALVLAYARFEGFRDVVNAVARFLVDVAVPAVVDFAKAVGATVGDLVAYVVAIWPQVSEAISHVLNVVAGIVRTTIDVVSALWRAWGDDLLSVARRTVSFVQQTVDNALRVVRGIIQTVVALINGDWGKAWAGIRDVFGGVWKQIQDTVSNAVGVVRSLVGGLASTVAEVARGMWEPIRAGFKAAINWIIDRWNGLEFKVPGWDPPGPGPKFGGFTIGVPDIPRLHSGGVVPGRRGDEVMTVLKAGELVIARRDVAAIAATPHGGERLLRWPGKRCGRLALA
jgi:phage-related protein